MDPVVWNLYRIALLGKGPLPRTDYTLSLYANHIRAFHHEWRCWTKIAHDTKEFIEQYSERG